MISAEWHGILLTLHWPKFLVLNKASTTIILWREFLHWYGHALVVMLTEMRDTQIRFHKVLTRGSCSRQTTSGLSETNGSRFNPLSSVTYLLEMFLLERAARRKKDSQESTRQHFLFEWSKLTISSVPAYVKGHPVQHHKPDQIFLLQAQNNA